MKRIRLTQDKFALIDDEDYGRVSRHKWCARKQSGNRDTWYALRKNTFSFKKSKTELLHRFVMNAPDEIQVDHINGNGLDCQKKNLRFATNSQNQYNKPIQRNNTSGYAGVKYDKRDKVWKAQISVNCKRIHLGDFREKKDAIVARQEAEKVHHGDFAYRRRRGK